VLALKIVNYQDIKNYLSPPLRAYNFILPPDVSPHSIHPMNKGYSDEGFTYFFPSIFFQDKKVFNSN
jgi:hypothetical protein